jgi:gliding motility-associated protein GldE
LDHHPVFLYILQLATPAAITTQATTILVFILIFLITLSFFVSGAEVAFFSLSHKEINMLKTKQQVAYKRIVDLLEDPKSLLASLLIANTLINICIIVVGNFLLDEMIPIGDQLYWVHFLIKALSISFLMIMFGEIMPKVMATQNNIRFAKDSGAVVSAIAFLFKGISESLVGFSDYVERKLATKSNSSYSLDELDNAIDNRDDNTSSQKEKNILKGIVKFGNITVKQVMKTRLDVNGIEYNASFKDMIKCVADLHYSRLPIYKNDLDEVVGMIHTKDLLPYLEETDFDWHTLIRTPYFIHEQKMIEDLLQEFQAKRIHFAVVVDEFGGTSGIVTLEDIMEEIIGDIRDEFDEDDIFFKKLDEFNYVFEGKTMINDVCKTMELNGDTFDNVRGDSDSLAGLVLEIAGEIPQINAVVPCGDYDFTILEKERNRLQKIKITIKPQEA